MRVRQRRYEVPGWGAGELWTCRRVVLAHEFAFGAEERAHVDWDDVAYRRLNAVVRADDEGAHVAPEREPRAAKAAAQAALHPGPRAALHAVPAAARDAGSHAAPQMGAHGPPTSTVPAKSRQQANGFVPSRRQSGDAWEHALVSRLTSFLAGDEVSFTDVELDLSWATPFQASVANVLRALPRGETVSYGELAALAGYPGAQRAAGTFCARNRFMFLVPCHRVVAAAGIGEYGSAGPTIKRRLLALEGVVV